MPRKFLDQTISDRLTRELIGPPTGAERTTQILPAVARALASLDSPAAVIDGVAYLLPDVFDADAAQLWLHDLSHGVLYTRQTCRGANWPMTLRIPAEQGPCGYAFQREQAVRVGDASRTTLWRQADRTQSPPGSMMLTPVFGRGEQCHGVLQVLDEREDRFEQADLDLLEAIATLVGLALEQARRIEAAERQFDSLVAAMMGAIDARDAVTVHHSANVANYAIGVGQLIGLDQRHLERLRLAALLHDIGKLGTADRLLTKAGPLDLEEMNQVKKHAAYTRHILRQVEFVDDDPSGSGIADLAAAHHERLDGSGYPDGLTGTQIPLDARILIVADMFHALTQPRHHRPGMDVEKALAVLDSQVPQQLDGRCVDALRRFLGVESTTGRAA